MAGNIFINYRRDESGHVAGRLHDSLAPTFGRNKLFMDVDNIPVGRDFEDYLKSQVAACDAMLAVIGPHWLTAKDETGKRRLDNPDDFIVIEIGAALARNIPVVPVLVDGARMPKASELPDSLKPLARRQAVEVRHTNFSRDAEALVKRLREAIGYDFSGHQWRVRAAKALAALAVLLLVGWAGYEIVHPTRIYLEEGYRAVQQLVEETKAERERQAKAAAEEQRKADEAERQRLAEAERQRLAAVKAEQELQAKAAAEAEAKRTADAKRVAAIQADPERQAKAAALAKLPYKRPLRCKAVESASEILDFEVTPEQSDGLKGIQIFTQGIEVSIREVTVSHVGEGDLVFHTIGGNFFVANNSTSEPLSLSNDSKPLSRVRLVYDGKRPLGSFVTPSLCIEGLKVRY